jgi:outer membrane PBP1 activator LpoA protein
LFANCAGIVPAPARVFNMTCTMTCTPRLILLAALALLLTACEPTRPTASVERAAALSARGDHAAAAREFEAVGGSTAESMLANPAWVNAAREWLRAADPAAAERALARLSPPIEAELAIDRDLLLAEAALQSDQAVRGWELLAAVNAPQTAVRLDAYHALRQQLALATNRPLQAIRSQLERENLAATPTDRAQLQREFLEQLRALIERGVLLDPRVAGRDAIARGWLEAAPLAARAAAAPRATNAAITAAWRKRHPQHPAFAALTALGLPPPPAPASAATPATTTSPAAASTGSRTAPPRVGDPAVAPALIPSGTPLPRTAHVAVLLPLSGRNAALGAQLRDGILAAQFAEPETVRTAVRFYDTARQPIVAAMSAAAAGGAEFIIGPLLREEVLAAATRAQDPSALPMLVLNFLPTETAAATSAADPLATPTRFWQFALSPEEEARAVARRALAEGKRRAIAFVPPGDWGTRVLAAFREELEAGGGAILASETLGDAATVPNLQQALRIDDSIARHRRIQAVIDTPLAFAPRRRGDIDFLFTPAPSGSLREWRAQLRFQSAGDLPAFATSDAYEGRLSSDLAGVMFPDMDWMIAPQAPAAAALRASTEAAFGETRGRGRLFAFGHDAWLLQRALRSGNVPTAADPVTGASGVLSLTADGRVQRSLRWALIENDAIKLLDDGP